MNKYSFAGSLVFSGKGYLAAFFVVTAGFLAGCQQELSTMNELPAQSFNLKLNFKPVVDGVPMEYNKPYTNQLQEAYSIQTFKFYITAVKLVNSVTGASVLASGTEHFLIDASSASTSIVSVKSLPGQYDQLIFTVGVDSVSNFSGAQTGALDPTNGMFWTWNSGYIMAKLEGTAPLSNQPNQKFEYHVGGFKGAENVSRKIMLSFPGAQTMNFLPETTNTVNLSANVNAWFNGSNNISIAANPVCMTPGSLATKIANNYSGMFTIMDIINN